MNFRTAYRAAMRKRAAAVLTPEAEQAAVQGGMGDPMAAQQGGMPPQDPSMMGGAGAPPDMAGMPQGSGGGQLPPEIIQDQQFIQWLAQQGVVLDQASGTFIGPDGQPLPVEAIVQAYQIYQQEMAAQQGGMPPQDPSMMGGAGAPPVDAGGMPPQDPSMMGAPAAGQPPEAQGGMPPQDPSMMGGAPEQGGQLPPEITQDQMFMQFMQEAVGAQFDPNSGSFIDPQSGQPLPPDMIMQAYQAYQQMAAQQGGMPPQDPSMMGGAAQPGEMGPGADMEAQAQQVPEMPPEIMEQFQSMVDSTIQSNVAQLEKKLETMLDKIETILMSLESIRDTDDKRMKADKDAIKQMQEDLAAELNPTVKTAAVSKSAATREPKQTKRTTRPLNVFDFLKI